MKKDIHIRIADAADAPTITALIYDSFAEHRSLYTVKAFDDTTPGISEIEDRIADKTVWVAVMDNLIAGTASALPRSGGLYIRSVAVSAGARRNGIANLLLEFMENIALEHDYSHLELTTTAFLLPARELYRSLGFRQEGVEDLHGTELIKLKKDLNPVSKNKTPKNDYAK